MKGGEVAADEAARAAAGENTERQDILTWLLRGDVSIQYQVRRDLLDSEVESVRGRIATEGWGRRYLSLRGENGHWGRGFYQPKWISTHYTLLDLRNLELDPDNGPVRETLAVVLGENKGPDGGMNPAKTISVSDVCVSGMVLNCASYFKMPEDQLRSIVDFLLAERMPDGGFNCESNRWGAVHSSLHTTLSVIEGIGEYCRQGYSYRRGELETAELGAREFLLEHRLFRSHRTGRIIDPRMLRLSYPSRWRYDILKALDHFRRAGAAFDPRMQDAVDILMAKRRSDGRWPLHAAHPGRTHFEMESPGKASRWNTLRALRVLKHIRIDA